MTCEHIISELRRRKIANGTITVQRQCTTCGAATSNALSQKTMTVAERDALPEWDTNLYEQFSAVDRAESARRREEADRAHREKTSAWWVEYRAYLKTDEWRAKRIKVFVRDKYQCQGCLNAPAEQCHHLCYDRVGDELLFELISLCTPCHDRVKLEPPIGSPP